MKLALEELHFTLGILLHELERLGICFAGRFGRDLQLFQAGADALKFFIKGLFFSFALAAFLRDARGEVLKGRGRFRG